MDVHKFVNGVFASNTYVCVAGADAWVIDPGDREGWSPFLEGRRMRGVFVTHSHFDHIYGVNELLEEFPDMTVYTSAYGRKGLYSDRLNFSRYHESPFVFRGRNVVVLKEGDRMPLGEGVEMEAMETPGHDPGCLSYKLGNYLFTGDSFIPGVPTVTKLRGGNREASMASLEKIRRNIREETVVCPGHGNMCNGVKVLNK